MTQHSASCLPFFRDPWGLLLWRGTCLCLRCRSRVLRGVDAAVRIVYSGVGEGRASPLVIVRPEPGTGSVTASSSLSETVVGCGRVTLRWLWRGGVNSRCVRTILFADACTADGTAVLLCGYLGLDGPADEDRCGRLPEE